MNSAYECISMHPLAVLRVILDDVCLSSLDQKIQLHDDRVSLVFGMIIK